MGSKILVFINEGEQDELEKKHKSSNSFTMSCLYLYHQGGYHQPDESTYPEYGSNVNSESDFKYGSSTRRGKDPITFPSGFNLTAGGGGPQPMSP